MKTTGKPPPVLVIFGDEEYQKSAFIERSLDALLPPPIDRTLALSTYDGSRTEEQGGPSLATVLDDLATPPFLAPRRVILVRDADRFISQWRDRLEHYLSRPSPTGTLILECRVFPKTTRLYRAVVAAGGEVHECRKLFGRALIEFVRKEARARGKTFDDEAAAWLCDLVGPELAALAAEVEKLSLYCGSRRTITVADVAALVGQSREEKVFKAVEAAGLGRADQALGLWRQVLDTDPTAIYRAVGGIAFMLRRWLDAQNSRAAGSSTSELCQKLLMWGRPGDVQTLLDRLPAARVQRLLADLAELDSQAKSGIRSIESAVESFLLRVAAAPA
jgi:DNA polymerase-3 subunit delta